MCVSVVCGTCAEARVRVVAGAGGGGAQCFFFPTGTSQTSAPGLFLPSKGSVGVAGAAARVLVFRPATSLTFTVL